MEAAAAGLPSTYLALLGTSSGSAASRFDLSGDPWVRVDGVAWVGSAADLDTSDGLRTGLNVTADGTVLFGPASIDNSSVPNPVRAFTGGDFSVPPPAEFACNDWTSSDPLDDAGMGNAQAGQDPGASCCSGGCSGALHLYCLQE